MVHFSTGRLVKESEFISIDFLLFCHLSLGSKLALGSTCLIAGLARIHLFDGFPSKINKFSKGPSIKDISPEGEGGGYPKRRSGEMGGRDPVSGKGDIFS